MQGGRVAAGRRLSDPVPGPRPGLPPCAQRVQGDRALRQGRCEPRRNVGDAQGAAGARDAALPFTHGHSRARALHTCAGPRFLAGVRAAARARVRGLRFLRERRDASSRDRPCGGELRGVPAERELVLPRHGRWQRAGRARARGGGGGPVHRRPLFRLWPVPRGERGSGAEPLHPSGDAALSGHGAPALVPGAGARRAAGGECCGGLPGAAHCEHELRVGHV